MKKILLAVALAGQAMLAAAANPLVELKTSAGTIVLELYPEKAPKTVANFEGLATGSIEWKDPRSGEVKTGTPLYNGVIFHRIIQRQLLNGLLGAIGQRDAIALVGSNDALSLIQTLRFNVF